MTMENLVDIASILGYLLLGAGLDVIYSRDKEATNNPGTFLCLLFWPIILTLEVSWPHR